MRNALLVIVSTLSALLFTGDAWAEPEYVPLPKIEGNRVAPQIVYVENPRFPSLSQGELKILVGEAARLVEEHFGIQVAVPAQIPVQHIDELFAPLIGAEPEGMTEMIGDLRGGNVNWSFVRDALVEDIGEQKTPLADQIAFAAPYLTEAVKEETAEAFGEAVMQTFKARLSYWTRAQAEDGYPVIGKVPGRPDLPLNEYLYWSLMAQQGLGGDIVITNQLVASVEYVNLPVHTSIRGGITAGSTEYNPGVAHDISVWLSVFPMLSNDEQIKVLRNGQAYSRADALRYAGAMLAHEMGHQLLLLGHPWANPACVMRPAELLDLASWVQKFDAPKCKVGSSPPMEPGVVQLPIW